MWTSPHFLAEYKLDGGRYLAYIHKTGNKLLSRERNLDRLSNLPQIQQILSKFPSGTVIDGELCSETFSHLMSILNSAPEKAIQLQKINPVQYYVFDLPFYNGKDLRNRPLKERRTYLFNHIINHPENLKWGTLLSVPFVPFVVNTKREFYDDYVAKGGEGVVLKDLVLAYGLGWYRVKARKDVSVIITGINQDRASVELGVYDNGVIVKVGNCSTNTHTLRAETLTHPNAYLNQVLDISCLRMVENSLRSPTWIRLRPDKDPINITMQKLREEII
jgi:bifunctional non-homologous end joining protein LigD